MEFHLHTYKRRSRLILVKQEARWALLQVGGYNSVALPIFCLLRRWCARSKGLGQFQEEETGTSPWTLAAGRGGGWRGETVGGSAAPGHGHMHLADPRHPKGGDVLSPPAAPQRVSAPSSRPSVSVSLAPVNHVGDILRPGFLDQQQGNHCPRHQSWWAREEGSAHTVSKQACRCHRDRDGVWPGPLTSTRGRGGRVRDLGPSLPST